MSFKLKIIEGPNKGAEIALPEGVAVTLGKKDECDIILADATLPEASLTLAATSEGVTLDGSPLELFAVTERGATAFAVGPADAPWRELKWPKKVTGSGERVTEEEKKDANSSDVPSLTSETKPAAETLPREKKRHGCLGCLVVLILLLLAIAALGWFFRDKAKPYFEQARPYLDQAKPYAEKVIARVSSLTRVSSDSCAASSSSEDIISVSPLENVIERYRLVSTNRAGRVILSGDFTTRADRLRATAEAYAAEPGIELDFCDNESLVTAAEDTFALVGENNLRVAGTTNRVLVLTGTAGNLRRTLEALASDLPKLRDVDCAGVASAANNIASGYATSDVGQAGAISVSRDSRLASSSSTPSLPVCGILTTPYPCLVLKSGARVLEGAPFGDSIVMKIEADAVTLTNSTGRIVWKP